jgi:hypothetical protein
MRRALLLLVLVACTTPAPSAPPDAPASAHARLSSAPARLWIPPRELAGAITAERRDRDAWSGATVDLAIARGELVLAADGDDVLVDDLELVLAPLALPDGLFDAHAELTELRVELAAPARASARWTDDDDAATFTAALALSLHWTLALDGSTVPLGAPQLPPIPVDVAVHGDGAAMEAELRLHAPGELWSWAGLVRLRELQLDVGARLL